MRYLVVSLIVCGAATVQAQELVSDEIEARLERGAEILGAVRDMVRHVEGLVDQARTEDEGVRLAAVNDALVQLADLVQLGEQALSALRSAKDEEERVCWFAWLTIIYQRSTVLVQQAESAMSEELAVIVQGSAVEIEVDPALGPALCFFDETANSFGGWGAPWGGAIEWCDSEEVDEAAWEQIAPRFEPDSDRFRFGLGGGILVTKTKWENDITDSPLAGFVVPIVSLRLTDTWRLMLEPGLTIENSSKNEGDPFGYALLLEAQWLSNAVVSPVIGGHATTLAMNFGTGSFRFREHGAHVGIAFPDEVLSLVLRILGGQETTAFGSAWTVAGMLEIRSVGSSRRNRMRRNPMLEIRSVGSSRRNRMRRNQEEQ